MPLLPRLVSLWRTLVRPSRLDREVDEELRGYVDALTERHVDAGMTPAQARRAALLAMENIDAIKDELRRGRVGNTLELWAGDFRYGWRRLRRAPGFTLAVVATLALGMGANTAIFSVVRGVLIAPLPYGDPSRLVFVWSDLTDAGYPRAPLSGPELNDLRERGALFAGFGAIWANTTALTGDGDPEQLRIGLVTTNFFSVLGVDAKVGRTFSHEDEIQNAPSAILLSWPLWQRRYGGDPSIVGRRILVGGRPSTVIGVMPPDFRLLLPPDAAVPEQLQAWQPFGSGLIRGPRGQDFLRVVGRMKPGVSLADAQAQIATIAAAVSREFTEYGRAGRVFKTVALHADGVRDLRPSLLALFAGVGILLLIACVNVAGLLLARVAARRHERVLRIALGASRAALFRECLAEAVLLALLGALAGLLVGWSGVRLLIAIRPSSLGRLAMARVDPVVLLFVVGVGLLCGLLFSLAPLLEIGRTNLITALQYDNGRSRGGLHSRTRAALVVAQLALSVVLLIGAGLLVRTFMRLQHVDPGFQSKGTLTFRVALPGARYRSPEAFTAFSRALQTKLAALPGVTGVGAISHVPYDDLPNWGGAYLTERGGDESAAPDADYRAVSPGFLETVDARLVAGRFFTEGDDQTAQPVAIVDDQLARRAWRGASPLGKQLGVDTASTGHVGTWLTVVGVVHHLRHRSLIADLTEQVYVSERQVFRNPMAYVVRTSGDLSSLAGVIHETVTTLDPQLPIYDVRPFDDYVVIARATHRFTMILAAAFAILALAVSAVGVYGVVSYSVASRRHEFGVRMALGATTRVVMASVLREGTTLVLTGLVFGLLIAAGGARLLAAQLFGVGPWDLATYLIAVAALAGTAAVACLVPAARATRANPLDALRTE